MWNLRNRKSQEQRRGQRSCLAASLSSGKHKFSLTKRQKSSVVTAAPKLKMALRSAETAANRSDKQKGFPVDCNGRYDLHEVWERSSCRQAFLRWVRRDPAGGGRAGSAPANGAILRQVRNALFSGQALL